MKHETVMLRIRGLKCDAPGCDYNQNEPMGNNYAEWARWLNAPCPKCGANLLTKADLDAMRIALWVINFINFFTWPLAWISSRIKEDRIEFSLGMDGSGKIRPRRINK